MPKTGQEYAIPMPRDSQPRLGSRPLTCVSLFAGAGGMALGFEQAGLTHLLLNEYDRHAVATLRANRPAWEVDHRDIHDVSFLALRGTVDVLEGGFPCQAFSASGNRQGFADPRGTLFFEFARAVREIRPRLAVAENVKGLRSHDGGRTLRTMVASLEEAGYQVAWRVLDASRFGVPQRRERLILVALQRGSGKQIVFPSELEGPPPTLRQAIGDGPAGSGQRYSASREAIMSQVPEGGNWRDLPAEVLAACLPNGPYQGGSCSGVARRLAWDKPSPTLLCSPVAKLTERCHPAETRPLNVREYARIQTFPDSWQFAGPVTAQYRQIGNAVPVALAYHLGLAAKAVLTEGRPEGFGQARHAAHVRRRDPARRSVLANRRRAGGRPGTPVVDGNA
ncbi:DNA cytosine methyltransferase [Parafrankia sp. FMc2]|uniref:DNA cytosine methyltransferase n=1 Tax=Parafrankia sp. FMc2 TaxID=3233196 RepID=UPI0034D7B2D6